MKLSILKLSSGFFVLWVILLLVVTSKVYFIQVPSATAWMALGLFGLMMLACSYLGAWAIWSFTGKDQRTGELTYLGIMTVFFLVRTVMLYGEAIAAR